MRRSLSSGRGHALVKLTRQCDYRQLTYYVVSPDDGQLRSLRSTTRVEDTQLSGGWFAAPVDPVLDQTMLGGAQRHG